jgi:uncharacterized phage protein gp47/JayE
MSNGFERKTRTEIVADMQAKAKNLWGNDINLTINTFIGIFIHLISYPISLLWLGLEAIYNAMDINAAEGQDLDNLAKKIGIRRYSSAKAVGEVTFTGDNNVLIPAGFQVETDEDEPKIFETTEQVIITSGSITVEIISIEGGSEYNVTSNTITKMTEVLAGIDDVTNEAETFGGRDRETDTELRERYFQSLDRAGGSTTTSVRANVLEETETSDCIILENINMEVDGNGLPAKSFETIVFGGANQAIADAIFEKKPAGIEPYGSITEIVVDDSGNNQDVSFSRAAGIDIYVEVDLVTSEDYPADGDAQVIDEIETYINSLSINENVIYRKIIDVIFNVTGVIDVNALYIDTVDPPTGEANITIGFREVSDIGSVVIT